MIGGAFQGQPGQENLIKREPLTGPDPWAQRNIGMTCMTCIWYVPKELASLGTGKVGRCRRHAPTMNGYPVVFMADWCGDHRLDENKA